MDGASAKFLKRNCLSFSNWFAAVRSPDGCARDYTSIITGLSISALNAASSSAPSAPSTTR